MTREPELFKHLFQCNIEGQAVKIVPTFHVSIGNGKETSGIKFHSFAPTLEYQLRDSNIFCFSILASVLHAYGFYFAARAIAGRTEASLVCECKDYYDKIKYDNAIILYNECNK